MSSPIRRAAVHAAVILALVLVACSPQSSGSGAPPTGDEAAQLVLGQQTRFAGIRPLDPNLIGQAAWYTVADSEDGWEVLVRIGWGDCPAGCINEHRWLYAVARDGTVSLLSEQGDPLAVASGVRGIVLAGPTCSVQTDPPDPDCDDRPVAGALLLITDMAGAEVARATTGVDGEFSVELAPGAYRLVPQPVEGLMGTAAPIEFGVSAEGPLAELTVGYDTGLR